VESFFYSVEYCMIAYLCDPWNEGKRKPRAQFLGRLRRLASKGTTLSFSLGEETHRSGSYLINIPRGQPYRGVCGRV
jgi:hypothetical protein